MTTATRRLTFAAGHRVLGHEGHCANLHGHNFIVEIETEADHGNLSELDAIGRVIDYREIKVRVGGWIENNWDHAFIYSDADAAVHQALNLLDTLDGKARKRFRLPTNPTSENLALFLVRVICPRVLSGTGVRAVRVRVWETENCWSDASL